MDKLIISNGHYDWINRCSGMILKSPEEFELMILYNEYERPMYICKKLCKEAVYAQRLYDLSKICRAIGLKRAYNLKNSFGDLNIEELVIQLQLKILIQGIKEIYYPDDPILNRVMFLIPSKIAVDLYKYGKFGEVKKAVYLNLDELISKARLRKHMVGFSEDVNEIGFSASEIFYEGGRGL